MEDMTVVGWFPAYVADVLDVIGDGGWLVQNFNVKSHDEALNPASYLYNSRFGESAYTACVDLNVFQFMVNSVKKNSPHPLYRAAIAYLAFCQVAEIEVDPTYAVYEKVNHQAERAREGVDDLAIFHRLNNMPTEELALYAAGESDVLNLDNSLDSVEVGHIESELTRYTRLKEWPSLYAIILAIVDIEIDSHIPARKKLGIFIEWSFRVFRNSLPGFVFAVSVFGHHRLGRAMKFDRSQPVSARKSALQNMTWDLYYMQQYFQRWVDRSPGTETMFLTNDGAFGQILGLSIEVQKKGSLDPLERYINKFDQQMFAYMVDPDTYPHERAYKSDAWGVEYRGKVISELEGKLLGAEA